MWKLLSFRYRSSYVLNSFLIEFKYFYNFLHTGLKKVSLSVYLYQGNRVCTAQWIHTHCIFVSYLFDPRTKQCLGCVMYPGLLLNPCETRVVMEHKCMKHILNVIIIITCKEKRKWNCNEKHIWMINYFNLW